MKKRKPRAARKAAGKRRQTSRTASHAEVLDAAAPAKPRRDWEWHQTSSSVTPSRRRKGPPPQAAKPTATPPTAPAKPERIASKLSLDLETRLAALAAAQALAPPSDIAAPVPLGVRATRAMLAAAALLGIFVLSAPLRHAVHVHSTRTLLASASPRQPAPSESVLPPASVAEAKGEPPVAVARATAPAARLYQSRPRTPWGVPDATASADLAGAALAFDIELGRGRAGSAEAEVAAAAPARASRPGYDRLKSRPTEPWGEPDAAASADLTRATLAFDAELARGRAASVETRVAAAAPAHASQLGSYRLQSRPAEPWSSPDPTADEQLRMAAAAFARQLFDDIGRSSDVPADAARPAAPPAPSAAVAALSPPPLHDDVPHIPAPAASAPALCAAPQGLLAARARAVVAPAPRPDLADDPLRFGSALAEAAIAETHDLVVYNAKYMSIAYPLGDVPNQFGVCTDVVIRAYRALGIDLQQLVHLSRAGGPSDTSIDHRRTELLRAFFTRYGASLPTSPYAEDYLAGDIVTYYRPQNRSSTAHIAVVTGLMSPAGRPMIAHNRGWGVQLEDALFVDQMTGHYRFTGTSPAVVALLKRDTRSVVAAGGGPATVRVASAADAGVTRRRTGLPLTRVSAPRGARRATLEPPPMALMGLGSAAQRRP